MKQTLPRRAPIIGPPTDASVRRFWKRVRDTFHGDPSKLAEHAKNVRPAEGRIIGHGQQLAMERLSAHSAEQVRRLAHLPPEEPSRQALRWIIRKKGSALAAQFAAQTS